jgi:hypothetical protein
MGNKPKFTQLCWRSVLLVRNKLGRFLAEAALKMINAIGTPHKTKKMLPHLDVVLHFLMSVAPIFPNLD